MTLNVSLNYNRTIENTENLKMAARKIFERSGGTIENTQKIVEQAILNCNKLEQSFVNPQISILKASTQISLNKSLCKTLEYLKENASKKAAVKPVFGELWSIFEAHNEEFEGDSYKGELYNFQINECAKNIFAS